MSGRRCPAAADPGSGVTKAGVGVWSVAAVARPGPTPGCAWRQAPTPTGDCLARAEQPSATRQRAVPSGGHGPGWAGLLSPVAGRWWQYQCPQPFWSGSLGPAVVSTQSAVYVHSYVSDCRPSACATVPGSPYPDLSPNSSLLSTHFLHTTDIISPRLGKNFH